MKFVYTSKILLITYTPVRFDGHDHVQVSTYIGQKGMISVLCFFVEMGIIFELKIVGGYT